MDRSVGEDDLRHLELGRRQVALDTTQNMCGSSEYPPEPGGKMANALFTFRLLPFRLDCCRLTVDEKLTINRRLGRLDGCATSLRILCAARLIRKNSLPTLLLFARWKSREAPDFAADQPQGPR